MTAKCLLGESMKVMAKALGDRNLGENTRARAKVAALLLIVVVTGTTRDNTVTTEDGEDNLLHPTLSHTIFHTAILSHTIFHTPSHSHNFLPHHLSHTSFATHHLTHTTLSHHLTHTTFSHTIFHTPTLSHIFYTQNCHTPSFTQHLTHTTLSHTIFLTPSFSHHLTHTTLSHTIFHTPTLSHSMALVTLTFVLCGRRGAWRHPPSLCVAGVALVALGWLWWRAWSPLVARSAAPLCVADVALGDIHLRFAWQAWHLVTSTFASRGRPGTWRHLPAFGVAGVALVALVWLWWRAWSPLVARGAAPLCVAGVALGDIHLRFTWQAWHLETFTCVWRGRRGTLCTWWRALSPFVAWGAVPLCVAW